MSQLSTTLIRLILYSAQIDGVHHYYLTIYYKLLEEHTQLKMLQLIQLVCS